MHSSVSWLTQSCAVTFFLGVLFRALFSCPQTCRPQAEILEKQTCQQIAGEHRYLNGGGTTEENDVRKQTKIPHRRTTTTSIVSFVGESLGA